MKVTLIDYTGNGNPDTWHAVNVLIFTKQTRLQMSPGLFKAIVDWPKAKKMEELAYMANTIPSSWEFVDYTFMVEGVTRAFTHQFVRSRQWSFAQQTMRVLNVEGWEYGTGPSIKNEGGDQLLNSMYSHSMDAIAETYNSLIKHGAAIEDARGVLPTNILTNIVGKCNMRTFVETVRKRTSPRTQDEYRLVLDAMKQVVREVHPWIDLFIERDVDKVIADLQAKINQVKGLQPNFSTNLTTDMTKLLDQLRAQL